MSEPRPSWCRCGGNRIINVPPPGMLQAPVLDGTEWREATFACDGPAEPWTIQDQQTGVRSVPCRGVMFLSEACTSPDRTKDGAEVQLCREAKCSHRIRPVLPSIATYTTQHDRAREIFIDPRRVRSASSDQLAMLWIELGFAARHHDATGRLPDRWLEIQAGRRVEIPTMAACGSWSAMMDRWTQLHRIPGAEAPTHVRGLSRPKPQNPMAVGAAE
jgi:hypothetical protein